MAGGPAVPAITLTGLGGSPKTAALCGFWLPRYRVGEVASHRPVVPRWILLAEGESSLPFSSSSPANAAAMAFSAGAA